MTHRELPEWPVFPYDPLDCTDDVNDKLFEYWRGKVAFYESRLREAVEALERVTACLDGYIIGINPAKYELTLGKSLVVEANNALSRIGPLPPEETSRE